MKNVFALIANKNSILQGKKKIGIRKRDYNYPRDVKDVGRIEKILKKQDKSILD